MPVKYKNECAQNIKLPSDGDSSGRDLGKEEIDLLIEVIKSGTLWSVRGAKVKQFEKNFAEKLGARFCIATSAGSAAIHTAIAAINPEPGDEIITTPITDMGAITPIIYQNAIPVFADVDPLTLNISAETIKPRISKRTKAIIVTHLFGNPCDMAPIKRLADQNKLPIIEDCCQAYLAEYNGSKVGTIGDMGCFSLQQGKHMTTGEGGIVTTENENFAKRMRLFVNKAWGYDEPNPDHYFLALNYRMTELQGAVAIAQLKKLEKAVVKRRQMAELLNNLLAQVPGLLIPPIPKGATHTYWRYVLRIDDRILKCNVNEIASKLKTKGIHCIARYIQKPAFMCQVLKEKKTYGNSQCPFSCPLRKDAGEVKYNMEDYPGAADGLAHVLVFPWNEFYTEEHVNYIASCIREAVNS